MLEILPSKDKALIKRLTDECGLPAVEKDTAFLLSENGTEIGVAELVIGNTSTLKSIGVIEEKRGQGYGDFFTRSLVFKMLSVSDKIRIGYQSAYFVKLGFKYIDGGMEAESAEVLFPSCCGGSK